MVERAFQNIKLDYRCIDELQNIQSHLKDSEVTSAVAYRRYCWILSINYNKRRNK